MCPPPVSVILHHQHGDTELGTFPSSSEQHPFEQRHRDMAMSRSSSRKVAAIGSQDVAVPPLTVSVSLTSGGDIRSASACDKEHHHSDHAFASSPHSKLQHDIHQVGGTWAHGHILLFVRPACILEYVTHTLSNLHTHTVSNLHTNPLKPPHKPSQTSTHTVSNLHD